MIYKFKTTLGGGAVLTGQHPLAPAGMSANGEVCTYEVTDVPRGVGIADVLSLILGTTLINGYSVPYAKLGVGKIVICA